MMIQSKADARQAFLDELTGKVPQDSYDVLRTKIEDYIDYSVQTFYVPTISTNLEEARISPREVAGGKGGSSIKVANATFKLKEFVGLLASSFGSVASGLHNPFVILCFVIKTICDLKGIVTQQIPEAEATVLMAVGVGRLIHFDVLYASTNRERKALNRQPLTLDQFQGALKNLLDWHCMKEETPLTYQIIESVRIISERRARA